MFSIEIKLNFEPIGNFSHNSDFFTLGKALLILLPLYLQILIMQTSSQADNRNYRKTLATKEILSEKMGLKFRNPNSTFYG